MNVDPPQIRQGHTLLIEVRSNRLITVTGTFDERPLSFVPHADGVWAVAGVPVTTEVGGRPIRVHIEDRLAASISTTLSVMVEAADFGSEQIHVPPDRVGLLDPEVLREEAELLGYLFAGITPRQFWNGAFAWPCEGDVTSPFGIWRTYDGGNKSYHGGIDVAAGIGAPVTASNTGRVAWAGSLAVRGNAVILDHGWGVYSGYYHLSEVLVSPERQVTQGQSIGRVGNTGLSTGAHLHWEVRVGGVLVNPAEWTERRIPE